ncbi:MAG: hypothetical protein ABDH28_07045 [Brevinematia bacterium]
MERILPFLIVVSIFIFFVTIPAYSKVYLNGIEVDEKEIEENQEHLRYRAVADMVFEESKVASLKYYERVLEKFPKDFVSLSRMSLVYALKGIAELSLYYGTNALEVYKKSDKRRIYTLNYIELLVGLSLSYAKLKDEVNSYFYLDEARRNLEKIVLFKSEYSKGAKLVEYANNFYRKEFYNLYFVTNTSVTNFGSNSKGYSNSFRR